MKNLLVVLFLFAVLPTAFSQFEAKINPIPIVWGGGLDISAEYVITPEFGIEARMPIRGGSLTLAGEKFSRFKIGAVVAGKYYFSPNVGGDNFYTGLYGKYFNTSFNTKVAGSKNSFDRNRFALGLLFGYKWVSDRGILVDINFGIGRAIQTSYTFESDELDDTTQDEIIGVFEGITNLIKIDLVGGLSVGYRFGNGSRSGA